MNERPFFILSQTGEGKGLSTGVVRLTKWFKSPIINTRFRSCSKQFHTYLRREYMKKYAIALLCAVAFASSASTVTSAKEIRTPFPNEIDAELHSILCYTPESYTADDESRELFLAAIEDARMLARAAIEDDLEAAYDESGEKCSVVDTISVDFNANPTPVFRDDKSEI